MAFDASVLALSKDEGRAFKQITSARQQGGHTARFLATGGIPSIVGGICAFIVFDVGMAPAYAVVVVDRLLKVLEQAASKLLVNPKVTPQAVHELYAGTLGDWKTMLMQFLHTQLYVLLACSLLLSWTVGFLWRQVRMRTRLVEKLLRELDK